MGKDILDTSSFPDLQPSRQLWARHSPEDAPLAFRAGNLRRAREWQRKTRKALSETLGLRTFSSASPRPKRIETVDKGDYVREKILLRTGPKSLMPVYFLLPKSARRPLPVVLAFHGHGYGVKDIVGLWEDGGERDVPDGYHKDFAVALCRAGFAVAAPEIACFGERQTDFGYLDTGLGQGTPSSCAHAAMLAFHLGLSVVGMRVHDGMRLVDYLQTRRDIDTNRLGAMGISGGGMHTFFSTCLDTRIRACVVSGYYSTFRDSIFAMDHCPCNYVPGLHRFGEMYDLVGLIAPRPLLVEAGDHDPIFPIRAVRRSVRRAREVYEVFGTRDRVATDYFQGRHQISGRKAYDFLRAHLDAPTP
jgi:dienelactone hydrolase